MWVHLTIHSQPFSHYSFTLDVQKGVELSLTPQVSRAVQPLIHIPAAVKTSPSTTVTKEFGTSTYTFLGPNLWSWTWWASYKNCLIRALLPSHCLRCHHLTNELLHAVCIVLFIWCSKSCMVCVLFISNKKYCWRVKKRRHRSNGGLRIQSPVCPTSEGLILKPWPEHLITLATGLLMSFYFLSGPLLTQIL